MKAWTLQLDGVVLQAEALPQDHLQLPGETVPVRGLSTATWRLAAKIPEAMVQMCKSCTFFTSG